MAGKPTWSVCDNVDINHWVLVRTLDRNVAESIAIISSSEFEPDDIYTDQAKEGEAWKGARGGLRNHWKSFGLPWKFDLEKIAQCDNVDILDANGNDIKQEFLGGNKMAKSEGVFGAIKGSITDIGSSAFGGVKLAAAGKANEAAYDHLKGLMLKAGIPATTINDPKFKEAIMLLLPAVLHPLATTFESQIPYAGVVKELCEASITEGVRKNSGQIIAVATGLFKAMKLSITAPLSLEGVLTDEEKAPVRERIAIDYEDLNVGGLRKLVDQREIVHEGTDRDAMLSALEADDAKEKAAVQ